MKLRRLVLLVALLSLSAISVACSKDKSEKPEIIESRGGSGESAGGPAPEIITSSPGSTLLLTAPGVTSAGTTPPGLTVTRSASATVPADQAFIVVLLQITPTGPFPTVSLAQRDRDAILAAVQALGVNPDNVVFETSTLYGPFASVNVEVEVSQVKALSQSIVGAISSIRGSQSSGVRYALRDCTAALAPLRKQAFEAAASDAQAFAAAVSLTLGPVAAVSEVPSINAYGPVQDPCNPDSQLSKVPTGILSLDSRPEVKLDVNLSVTYALAGAGAQAPGMAELTAAGAGKVTAKANEAYVLIATSLQGGGPFGPPQLQTRDRDDLIAEIKKLGIKEDDIKIDSAGFGGPVLIYVEVDMKKLPQIGRDIANAVQDVIGSAEQQGVHFTHSNCEAVLEEARKQAVADARRQAESLARSAGVTLGNLLSINEGGNAALGPYAQPPNDCSEDFTQLFQLGPYAAAVVPFDSPAEFTVTSTLLVRYGITGP